MANHAPIATIAKMKEVEAHDAQTHPSGIIQMAKIRKQWMISDDVMIRAGAAYCYQPLILSSSFHLLVLSSSRLIIPTGLKDRAGRIKLYTTTVADLYRYPIETR